VQDVFVWLSKHEGESSQKAISALGLETISEKELKALIDKIVEENEKLIKERGEGSFGILMGVIMKNLRGKTDATQVSKLLKEKLKTAAK